MPRCRWLPKGTKTWRIPARCAARTCRWGIAIQHDMFLETHMELTDGVAMMCFFGVMSIRYSLNSCCNGSIFYEPTIWVKNAHREDWTEIAHYAHIPKNTVAKSVLDESSSTGSTLSTIYLHPSQPGLLKVTAIRLEEIWLSSRDIYQNPVDNGIFTYINIYIYYKYIIFTIFNLPIYLPYPTGLLDFLWFLPSKVTPCNTTDPSPRGTLSRMPPTGKMCPRKVISPVTAVSLRTGRSCDLKGIIEVPWGAMLGDYV